MQAVERAAEGGVYTGAAHHALAPDACEARLKQDRSSRQPAFAFLTSSIVWLVLCSLAGLGVVLWMLPRLLGAELVGARFAIGDAADVARDIARKVHIPETDVFGEQSAG